MTDLANLDSYFLLLSGLQIAFFHLTSSATLIFCIAYNVNVVQRPIMTQAPKSKLHVNILIAASATPKLLINLVISRGIPTIMLLLKVLVVLLDLLLLLVGQGLRLAAAGDAGVGDLGLGRRILGRAVEGLAAARHALCAAVGEAVDDAGVALAVGGEQTAGDVQLARGDVLEGARGGAECEA